MAWTCVCDTSNEHDDQICTKCGRKNPDYTGPVGGTSSTATSTSSDKKSLFSARRFVAVVAVIALVAGSYFIWHTDDKQQPTTRVPEFNASLPGKVSSSSKAIQGVDARSTFSTDGKTTYLVAKLDAGAEGTPSASLVLSWQYFERFESYLQDLVAQSLGAKPSELTQFGAVSPEQKTKDGKQGALVTVKFKRDGKAYTGKYFIAVDGRNLYFIGAATRGSSSAKGSAFINETKLP